jgi:cobalt transporter subunit CbtB
MISGTIEQTRTGGKLIAMVAAALFGVGIVFLAGHVQATVLHDAAHDVRHATGFPCH